MTRSYYVKKDCQSITLAVHVSTPGEATTVVTKKRSGGVAEELADSPNADGIIPKQDIGNAERLGDSVLDIVTMIELDQVPQNLWDSAYENLVVQYTIAGGIDGEQQYEYDNDDKSRSSSKKVIVVKKAIKINLV